MELGVTTPDVNLGKLVLLEVHGRVGNAKIVKKYFSMSEWCVYGGTSPSGSEKPLLVPLELAGKPRIQITNRKLDWVLGASTDVQAWIMSCPAPG